MLWRLSHARIDQTALIKSFAPAGVKSPSRAGSSHSVRTLRHARGRVAGRRGARTRAERARDAARASHDHAPRAQRFFDQGLRLLYAFNHAEAIRAFREAARLDPVLAMAYWGQALALGPNLNAPMTPENGRLAYAAIQARAVRGAARDAARARARSRRWRARYARRGRRRSAGTRPRLCRRRCGRSPARFPATRTCRRCTPTRVMNTMPWDYWQKDGTPKPATARILAALEAVIARHPDHAGALHYHIHLLEASTRSRSRRGAAPIDSVR